MMTVNIVKTLNNTKAYFIRYYHCIGLFFENTLKWFSQPMNCDSWYLQRYLFIYMHQEQGTLIFCFRIISHQMWWSNFQEYSQQKSS